MATLSGPWWGFLLLGICAGIVSGTLGLGSGIIFIPALVLLFAFPQKSAQGTALAVMVPMALAGALHYKLNPQIEMNMLYVSLLAVGAVGGALAGARLARYLPGNVLRKIFAIFIIFVAIKMVLPTPKSARLSSEGRSSAEQSTDLPPGQERLDVSK